MNIQEIENDKSVKVKGFKFSCDGLDDTIPPPLPNTYNHFWIFTARPRMGKSTLIYNLLTKQRNSSPYYKKFDKIYIVSPSTTTCDEDPFAGVPEEQKATTLDVDTLNNIIEKIHNSGERILLILDDVITDIKRNKEVEKILTKLLFNRRHICGKSEDGESAGLSVWITSQVYNQIPRPIRACASQVCIFQSNNKKELETIYEELISLSRKEFRTLLDYVFDKKYQFLYINLDNTNPYNQYHKCFNKLKLSNITGFV